MNTSRNIPGFVYKLMLLAATIIWGIAFVVMKDAVDVLPPAQLIGVRFFLTGLLMAAVFHRSLRGTLNGPCLRAGLVLALVTFLAFWVQTIGLADTTPGKNAFLTATYCVIVPFLLWIVARKRPTFANVGAAVLCIAGIGLVSMTAGSFRLEFGDLMTLLCAVFFAAQIIAISHYAQQFNVLALTVYQFLFGGLMGLVLGGLTEPAPTLAVLTPDFAFNLFYLVVFASGLCYLFQNVGLAHVAPAQGSLLLSLESVFGVLASVLLYGEVVTGRMMLGFVLIFAAILISELAPTLKAKLLEQKRQTETTYDPEEECAPVG
ncbi:DMT family transporter [uncultured Adlercreutzia sp.]|uniref:DMT family transporter n=2 Tax=uncultured Adlercreutzia sp. TaxID=875803 RepID=UPI0025D7247F|nr:DMT family transporter [uncultured Adlercreutzia sp.]MCI9261881.1 DMT family transporter [Eggerthellaceae bacterium]